MNKRLTLIITTLFLLAACSSPKETTSPSAATVEVPTPIAGSTPSFVLSDPRAYWKEFREPRFGFGIVIPCWWQVTPMPVDGEVSTMNIRNYDDAYFLKYSENGTWKGGTPPQGVISIDITALSIDPNLSIEEAYMQRVDPNTTELVSAKERNFGNNTYTVITIRNKTSPNYPALTVYAIGLNSNTMLAFIAYPPQEFSASDVQAILASFAGNKAQSVTVPEVAPSPALSDMSCPI